MVSTTLENAFRRRSVGDARGRGHESTASAAVSPNRPPDRRRVPIQHRAVERQPLKTAGGKEGV
ncbi:hypothetical protein EA472_00105 [Natrarchaeobius oligotrophus]|uniref:Uncharacterized protein n=1 Tax=Natrarchaeobius chitinivorans TaxID=1679083 RepID=A0A3N6N2G2_NATCH|nr:hypothetical protein EA472_00105 [Natrarchaeobius chitinivorans]